METDSARSPQELIRELDDLRAQVRVLGGGDAVTQAKLAAIVESSDDAIVSKSLDGTIRTWNKGAERIFGYTADEIIGKSIFTIIPPERHDEEPRIIAQLEQGFRIDHYETVRMAKGGRKLFVSVTISPIRDATGRVVGASKIARDVTFQKEVEEQLRVAKELAESANRAKDHFLSVLSHELRTPLTPVLAEMSFLETRPDFPAEFRENIAMVRRNIETEARLVDDLLDITRISQGKVNLRQEVVDLHAAVHATLAMFKTAIENKALEVTVALRARQHHVWADAGRLQQILLNLVSNAVKFTPENGALAIRSSSDDRQIHLAISDSGMGIEPELLGLLFQAFKQSDRTRRFGGLGLGLSIARSLARMHGGDLVAASEGKNKGATFTLSLSPVAPTHEKSRPKIDDAVEPLAWKILLVEDHEDTRRVMQRLLQSLGCAVVATGTVREAVALAEKGNFDLLISDIGLPDGTGMDAITQINRRQKLRGIALSGYGQEDDLQRSRDAGFETHLTKPVDFETLRETIRKVARGPA